MNDIVYVLIVLAFLVHFIGALSISCFIPYIFKYGIKISNINLGKMDVLDFSGKIGNVYEKKYSRIKVISQNVFYIAPRYHFLMRKMMPYCIIKCINANGEYKIISEMQLTFFVFPIMSVIIYSLEKEIALIMIFSFFFFLIMTLLANNWISEFVIMEIRDFISGIGLERY